MLLCYFVLLIWCFDYIIGAILAPPWADPALNPCALLPRGWQMLYWPPDGKCYKIFKMGYPCPETMELTPGNSGGIGAICRCPPKTLRLQNTNICYAMFSKGPCQPGEYLTPYPTKQGSEFKYGKCQRPPECPDPTQIYWPNDDKCHRRFSKGPCDFGNLLTTNGDGLAVCRCDVDGEYAWEENKRCYEHYTKGPCQSGQLFLPGGKCGCTSDLPHYHSDTGSCYEIGSIGPCNTGHRFSLSTDIPDRAKCRCKPNYAFWENGSCYRLYTRGPCGPKELFAPPSRCVPLPCRRSRLYFPDEKRCFKIGSQGPCKAGQVVIFDFEARPSIDGIAHNGVCGCANSLSFDKQHSSNPCSNETALADGMCSSMPSMVPIGDMCYMLYTKGPCQDGQWLVPAQHFNSTKTAVCTCKPGFTETTNTNKTCLPPTVSLAKYLNEHFNKNS